MATQVALNQPASGPFGRHLRDIVHGNSLDEPDAGWLLGDFMDGNASNLQTAALLSALATKGEVVSEVVGAARAMRARSIHVEHQLPLVIDLCGTGGDRRNTLNISTMASFVVAAAGVPVAKHGNRAASSRCGSADVLEAAGFPITLAPASAAAMLSRSNFTFMFAQLYHPAMKNVAPVRRELPIRTIFNLLGPLTNPASATHQVIGVAHRSHVELIGEALRALGTQAAAVVHAENGIDEVAGDCPTYVFRFDDRGARRLTIDPRDYGIDVPLGEIAGGSPQHNAAALVRVLRGEPSGAAEVVALNAALALVVAGAASDVCDGLRMGRNVLKSGAAYEVLCQLRDAA
ncbi:MAG: anthranilate phosphoribosyltransferase [Candidatus Eremiobacteraeota bacterium]|nr:anthranilate phosphoribosyltransferase [Candidatus Eremiobacteraeota bacterium]